MSLENAYLLGVMVLVFITLVPTIDTILRWMRGPQERRISGQPIEVREANDFQTRKSCEAMHATLQTTIHGIDQGQSEQAERIRKEFKADIAAVYQRVEDHYDSTNERLTDIVRGIGELSGQIRHLSNGGKHGG